MAKGPLLVLLSLTVAAFGRSPEPRQPATNAPRCAPASALLQLPGLQEASGVAASRRSPGILWAHNDSGSPVLFALDENGRVIRSIRVEGAGVEDWEDVAVAPCPQGTCVYIADIGDNDGSRERITIYRVPEPSPSDASTRRAEAFHATYPDGAHDAEALFVTGDGRMYVITKGDPGPVALYRFPNPPDGRRPMRLQRVGPPLAERSVEARDRPTAADVSDDGDWVAFRTTQWLEFHSAADLTAGRWRTASRVDLSGLRERRGEGLALGRDGTVFLVGEGRSGRGTFARLNCTIP